MKDFFNSNGWNIFILIILALVALFTQEIVTFTMLGFLIIILTNIYSVLKEISAKLDANK